MSSLDEKLAINGGPKAVEDFPKEVDWDMFHWPIVTEEDEQAVLEVLRAGSMSGIDITQKFEDEFAEWMGVKYALGHSSGTQSLLNSMFAVGVGRGDEIICPSITYWASCLQVFSLGATVVFADVDPQTLCIDPEDIERHVSPRTKAIVAVHYCGHPCKMDEIMAIARKHNLKVIEDVSHAQGALYKGQMVGTFGDVAGISLMAGKSFAIGEAGMMVTNDQKVYERAIAFGHYVRHNQLTLDGLKEYAGLPFGGIKGRMNQTCAAMGRVQLKYYHQRIEEIQKAINYFWDILEGTPGLKANRPAKDSGSTMGGWYKPSGFIVPEELGGLTVDKFVDAVNAEGGRAGRKIDKPLHLHPVLNDVDVYNDGKPTRLAFADRDLRQGPGSLPNAENVAQRAFCIPYFKKYRPEIIEQYANAYKKVALQAGKLV